MLLVQLGDAYQLLDKGNKRDSVFEIALQIAYLNDSLTFKVDDRYFKCDYHYINPSKALEYGNKMLAIAKTTNDNESLYHAYADLAIAYLVSHDNNMAIDDINKAYYYASQLNDDIVKAQCMLTLGYCKEVSNKKIEAFRAYSDALFLAEKNGNDALKIDCYQKLSNFYAGLKKYDKAGHYAKSQIALILKQRSVDSNKLTDANISLADIMFHNHEIQQAEKLTQNIIAYTKRICYWQANVQAFVLYRTYLVDNGFFTKLRDLYEIQYPEEYRKLSLENTSLYYRLNCYILEANGKPDSARLFYQLAEKQMTGKNAIPLSNFYKRYGEFLLRQNDVKTATMKFDSAYKYALVANYFPYLIETTHYLDSLNYLQKDVDKAYQFAILNKHYTEQQAEVNKGEEMLQLEVENEARQQELRVQMEEKETERRHNLQYTGMVIAIISFFILLTLLGTFKVHPSMIRALGFFSFIFFFEFITMIADHRIHDYTHGEPWKFMAFKIVLIAGLLPLHHWLEEKVIHYLVHHHMLDSTKLKMKIPAIRKKEKPVPEQKPSDN